MSIVLQEVVSRKQLKTFVTFPFRLYRGNPCWIPPLIRDEMEVFTPEKNPCLKLGRFRLFLAYRDQTPVGRVALILNERANEKYQTRNLRIGWLDFEEDEAVLRALLGQAIRWARDLGMETLTGPHGFTDMDPEGMLVEGFDRLGTIATLYNHAYYPRLMEAVGFEKEVDYVEFLGTVPHQEGLPPKLVQLAERVAERGGFRLLHLGKKALMGRALEIMELMDETFAEIYGSVPLDREMLEHYVRKFFPFVDPDLVKLVENQAGELIAFLITMPSLSRAMQKARGRLLPWGWWHLLRGLKKADTLDFYLAGVRERYRGQGADLLMVMDIAREALRRGYLYSESNVELENNHKIQAQWKHFHPEQHKRRRIYRMVLPPGEG